MERQVRNIIEKWYRKLNFPQKFDVEFQAALGEIDVPADSCIENYSLEESDGRKNLLSFLYFCEKTQQDYAAKGISSEILYDTLRDLVIWTETWTDVKGSLCMNETGWLKLHLSSKLFKLGRLQFAPGEAEVDVPAFGISEGEPVMEIHIPAVGPLDHEACLASLERAKEFFATYFPEHRYRYFTCHSWLMDTSLKEILGSDSNIIQFQNMFDVVREDPEDAILRYVFKWDTTREKLPEQVCTSGFAKKVKDLALDGRTFYVSLGILR